MKFSTRLESYSQTLSESAGIFTCVGVLLVTLVSSNLVFELMQYIVINYEYGHAAWVSGLRISDWKHGEFSNGELLAGWTYVFFYLGSFILTVIPFLGSLFLFSYLGLRLRGRRLNDPKPKKKKWQTFR